MQEKSVVVAAMAHVNGSVGKKVRVGLIAKLAVPTGENQRRVGVLTLPVDRRWLDSKLLKVKQPHVKKPPLKELIGIRKSKLWLRTGGTKFNRWSLVTIAY